MSAEVPSWASSPVLGKPTDHPATEAPQGRGSTGIETVSALRAVGIDDTRPHQSTDVSGIKRNLIATDSRLAGKALA